MYSLPGSDSRKTKIRHLNRLSLDSDAAYSDDLSLEKQLCFAIYSCSNQVARLHRNILQSVGITYTQYLVLLALWEKDNRNIGELAHVLDLEPNTVTPMVKRMENLGLVSRSRHASDERQVWVTVTQRGLDLRTDVFAIQRDWVPQLDLPDEELAGIRDAVRHFSERITQARFWGPTSSSTGTPFAEPPIKL